MGREVHQHQVLEQGGMHKTTFEKAASTESRLRAIQRRRLFRLSISCTPAWIGMHNGTFHPYNTACDTHVSYSPSSQSRPSHLRSLIIASSLARVLRAWSVSSTLQGTLRDVTQEEVHMVCPIATKFACCGPPSTRPVRTNEKILSLDLSSAGKVVSWLMEMRYTLTIEV